jgi:hypothetical protein
MRHKFYVVVVLFVGQLILLRNAIFKWKWFEPLDNQLNELNMKFNEKVMVLLSISSTLVRARRLPWRSPDLGLETSLRCARRGCFSPLVLSLSRRGLCDLFRISSSTRDDKGALLESCPSLVERVI